MSIAYTLKCDMCGNVIDTTTDEKQVESLPFESGVVRFSENTTKLVGLHIYHLCPICAGYAIGRMVKLILELNDKLHPYNAAIPNAFKDVFDGSK